MDSAVSFKMGSYNPLGRCSYIRLDEKGGKQREIPCHHQLEEYLDAYIEAAALAPGTPMFRSAVGRTGRLTERAMSRTDAYAMVQRRVEAAKIRGRFSNHSFRATGITTYLENGGTLEKAQWIAGHSDPRTTELYDRRNLAATVTDMQKIDYSQ